MDLGCRRYVSSIPSTHVASPLLDEPDARNPHVRIRGSPGGAIPWGHPEKADTIGYAVRRVGGLPAHGSFDDGAHLCGHGGLLLGNHVRPAALTGDFLHAQPVHLVDAGVRVMSYHSIDGGVQVG